MKILLCHHEKVEQFTRRDNLRLLNFPSCSNGELRDKFVDLGTALGATIQSTAIKMFVG